MRDRKSPFSLCPTLRVICFWGERSQYAPWKRTTLLIGSPLMFAAVVAAAWFVADEPRAWVLWLVCMPLGLLAIAGLASAIWGCNSCVVRVWGDVG